MPQSQKPPFRADHVGSLLRPAELIDARNKWRQGELTGGQKKLEEDKHIRDAIKLQQDIGLKAVTDGEFRRWFWHFDFMGALTGIKLVERDKGVQFHGMQIPPIHPTITGRLDFPDDHPMLNHYRYLASVATVQPKISIPRPSCCHFRTASADITPAEYTDPDILFADIATTYAKAVKAFYAAGCRYLQMDDIFFAYLCDSRIRAEKKAQGQDPGQFPGPGGSGRGLGPGAA